MSARDLIPQIWSETKAVTAKDLQTGDKSVGTVWRDDVQDGVSVLGASWLWAETLCWSSARTFGRVWIIYTPDCRENQV